jgi:hypothetical protein
MGNPVVEAADAFFVLVRSATNDSTLAEALAHLRAVIDEYYDLEPPMGGLDEFYEDDFEAPEDDDYEGEQLEADY